MNRFNLILKKLPILFILIIGAIGVHTLASCSSDPEDGGSSSSEGNAQGVSSSSGGTKASGFDESKPVVGEDGKPISGVIKMYIYGPGLSGNLLLDAGTMTNGVVALNLPATIPDEYLNEFRGCEDISDAKWARAEFMLYSSDGQTPISYFGAEYKEEHGDDELEEQVVYCYFPKDTKITCNGTVNDEGWTGTYSVNIDAKAGWVKIYEHESGTGSTKKWVDKKSTDSNILTKEFGWALYNNASDSDGSPETNSPLAGESSKHHANPLIKKINVPKGGSK